MYQMFFVLLAFLVVGFKLYAELAKDILLFKKKKPQELPRDPQLHQYLQQIQFYKKLNLEDQQTFMQRVEYFRSNKHFVGMEGLVITDEIRAIVAASAVQIAFRLNMWEFPSYHTFRIYPESFYSSIFRKFLKGGAGYQGQVWFSLSDYRDGYADPENGINLGLHEMAHALIIEMENGNLDHEFVAAYETIEKLSMDRIPKINNKLFTFLRPYAGTNQMEFIAVSTEYFFERPDEFRQKDLELYDALMWLYKQEPHTPPSIREITNLPPQRKVKPNYRFSSWHWSLTLVLLGIFIAPGILIWQFGRIQLDGSTLFTISSAVILGSAVLLYKPIVKSSALGVTQFVLCHIFGLGPFVLSVFLLLNNNIIIRQEAEYHTIESWSTSRNGTYIANPRDGALQHDSKLREIDSEQYQNLRKGDVLVVFTDYGLFGIPVHGRNLVYGPNQKPLEEQ